MKKLFSILCVILCVGFATTSWGMIPDQEDNPVEIVQVSLDQEITATTVFIKQVDLSSENSYIYNTFTAQDAPEVIFEVTSNKISNVAVPDIPIIAIMQNYTLQNQDVGMINYNLSVYVFRYLKQKHSNINYNSPYVEPERLCNRWRA